MYDLFSLTLDTGFEINIIVYIENFVLVLYIYNSDGKLFTSFI